MYTLQGKTRSIRHVYFPRQSTHAQHTLPAGGLRTWQPLTKTSIAMDRATAPEKKGSRHNPQHVDWPIRGSVLSFSPEPAIEAVGVKPPSVSNQLLGLPSPYHRHVIGMFKTCSRVPTPQSLTDASDGQHETPIIWVFKYLLPTRGLLITQCLLTPRSTPSHF
jgi:hypothetical protein